MKFSELGNLGEYRETGRKPVDIGESMIEQADEIYRLLDSIKLEDEDEEKRSGIDGKWIRENETREYKFAPPIQSGADETLKKKYSDAVKRLALAKLKNDLLFEGQLNATMRRLSSMGLNITRERFLRDIEKETVNQQMSINLNANNLAYESPSEIDPVIAQLLGNLDNIFNTDIDRSTIPRKSAMQSSENQDTPRNNFSQTSEPAIQPQVQPIMQSQEMPLTAGTERVSQNQNNELQEKNQVIDQIIGVMLDAGEFSNTGEDIIVKMRDIEYAKSQLQSKSLEDLQFLLSTYQKTDVQETTRGR